MKQITVDFDESGNPVVETSGFEGAECQKATQGLERALGSRRSEEKKPEFNARPQQSQRMQGKLKT